MVVIVGINTRIPWAGNIISLGRAQNFPEKLKAFEV
jgi:hypothetical protein